MLVVPCLDKDKQDEIVDFIDNEDINKTFLVSLLTGKIYPFCTKLYLGSKLTYWYYHNFSDQELKKTFVLEEKAYREL